MTTAITRPARERGHRDGAGGATAPAPEFPEAPDTPDALAPVLLLAGYDDEDSADRHICRGID